MPSVWNTALTLRVETPGTHGHRLYWSNFRLEMHVLVELPCYIYKQVKVGISQDDDGRHEKTACNWKNLHIL
jgi:hypothetical protein